MKMRKPKRAFQNHPLNFEDKENHRERLEAKIAHKKIVRGTADSYHSFVPETTYIVKKIPPKAAIAFSVFYAALTLIIKFIEGNIYNSLFYILILIAILALILRKILISQNSRKIIRNIKDYKFALSKEGIMLEGKFYDWHLIENEKILEEKPRKAVQHYLFFTIKDSLHPVKYLVSNFVIRKKELKYLLSVYRKRNEGHIIIKSDEYERKYMNLSKEKRKNYIV